MQARWAGAPGAFKIKSRRHLALLQPSHVLHDDDVNVGALQCVREAVRDYSVIHLHLEGDGVEAEIAG